MCQYFICQNRYVPYCSSDSWSGSNPAGSTSRFAFMGSVIIQEVLRDLLSQGLLNASKLMLTGSRYVSYTFMLLSGWKLTISFPNCLGMCLVPEGLAWCSIWIASQTFYERKARRLKYVESPTRVGFSTMCRTHRLIARILNAARPHRPFRWVTVCGTVKCR